MRGAGDPVGTLDDIGQAPAATVHAVVTLATLLGLDDGVGQVPGWLELLTPTTGSTTPKPDVPDTPPY